VALHHFAVALLKQGKFGEAEPPARESLDIARKQIPTARQTFSIQGDLGAVLLGQKKYAAAEPELLASYTGMKQREATIPIQSKRVFKESLERLVQFYEITGKTDQAGEWRKALDDIDGARTNRAAPTPQPKP
jgi:hypothetical protein